MFKFFRQYHKLILVVGAAFLMVAFLIQPVLSMFMTSPQDAPIGRINGEYVTIAERNTAAAELQVLNILNPGLGALARQLAEDDPVKWLLMVRDARSLGIGASRFQVDQLLYDVLGVEDPQIQFTARQVAGTDDLVRQAVRHWIMLEQYRALMLGQEHLSPFERLVRFVERASLIEEIQRTNDIGLWLRLQQLRGTEEGAVRMSEPLIQWFIANHQATVSGQALLIDAGVYLDEIDAPTDAQLQAQFEQYRDVPAGESEPFGFGYRHPDRVRLEWLAMPVDELREQVDVDLVDVLEYYRANRDQFRDPEPAQDPDNDQANADAEPRDATRMPVRAIRRQIESRLRDEQAQRIAQQMAHEAHGALQREVRRIEQVEGYRRIPADFEPISLDELAERLEQEYGVRPQVHRRTDEWVSINALQTLPGLGRSHLDDRSEVGLPRYVASARELEPGEDEPLVALRLQTQVPGRVMATPDGSRYVFRLTAAAPSAPPASLEEVREQVERDVRLRLAYERLEAQRDQWQRRAVEEGFESLAAETHVRLQPIREIPRRTFMGMSDQLEVPAVPGIGPNRELVDTMFEIAERVSDRGREAVDQSPEAQRVGAVPVASELSLAVFRVDTYRPITRDRFEQQATGPGVEVALTQLLVGVLEDPLFISDEPALSKEVIARRVGFEAIDPVTPDAQGPRAPAGPRPGSL